MNGDDDMDWEQNPGMLLSTRVCFQNVLQNKQNGDGFDSSENIS